MRKIFNSAEEADQESTRSVCHWEAARRKVGKSGSCGGLNMDPAHCPFTEPEPILNKVLYLLHMGQNC